MTTHGDPESGPAIMPKVLGDVTLHITKLMEKTKVVNLHVQLYFDTCNAMMVATNVCASLNASIAMCNRTFVD